MGVGVRMGSAARMSVWRVLIMKGHEAVVGGVNDTIESRVESKDDDDDEPAGNKVDEEADFVAAKPAPCYTSVKLVGGRLETYKHQYRCIHLVLDQDLPTERKHPMAETRG
jgi:hypothetical protein